MSGEIDFQYREAAYGIYEYGLVQRLAELQAIFTECGLGAAGVIQAFVSLNGPTPIYSLVKRATSNIER